MTDAQKIERLATEVMGWHEGPARMCGVCRWWRTNDDEFAAHRYIRCDDPGDEWNPLFDWNHWRQVEMEALSNDLLMNEYLKHMTLLADGIPTTERRMLIYADLPTRVDALLAALDSSSQNTK